MIQARSVGPPVFGSRAPTLPSLTGLRFVAAFVVFLSHLVVVEVVDTDAVPASTQLLGLGGAGVSLFFVLSGFVLAWGHRPSTRAPAFWLRRAARIVPLHLAGVALAVLVSLTFVPVIRTSDPVAFVANVLLVSAWRPEWWQAGNPVSWTLVCEAFFYAVFPLLIVLLRARRPPVLLAVGVLVVGLTATSSWLAHLSPIPFSGTSTPLFRLPEFVLGIVTALLVRRTDAVVPLAPAALLAAAGLALTAPALQAGGPVSARGVTAAAFALLIAALAARDRRGARTGLAGRRLDLLGRSSYAFYLVHLLVIASVASAWPDGHPRLALLPALAVGALALAIALGLAIALHCLVEVPARRAVLRRERGGRAPALA